MIKESLIPKAKLPSNIMKSSSEIHYLYRIKEINNKIILFYTEKLLDKVQCLLMMKTRQSKRNGDFLNLVKFMYQRRSALGFLWKEWCWSWNSSTLATSCGELTHCKRLWCWEGLGARGEGDDRGWDDWMASRTQWTRVWVNSGSWWWTGRPGVLRFMGSQRVGHDWVTELNLRIYKLSRWF